MRLITKISDAIIGLVMHELSESTRVIKRWGAKRKIYEVVHGVPIIKNNISSPKTVSSKIEKNDFRVLVFGGIHPAKAYELVLHAFKRFLLSFGGKGVKLIIAGHPNPGPLVGHNESYAEFLKKLASELGITDHIELYCRYLSEEEVSFLFDTSDALIVSYGIRIGPSGVFARAISHKLPTIITADEKYVTFKSPLPAIIVPGTGRSESEIIEGIAKALSLLKTNKFLADKLKVKMEKYRLKYSFNKIGEAYLKIFEHVIEGYK